MILTSFYSLQIKKVDNILKFCTYICILCTYFTLGSYDKTVRVWGIVEGKSLLRLQSHAQSVSCVCWNPDGTAIASGSWDKTINVHDSTSGELLLTLKGHGDAVKSISWGGSWLVSGGGSDYTARVWDCDLGSNHMGLEGHSGGVKCVSWDSRQKRFVTGSVDKTVSDIVLYCIVLLWCCYE